MTQTDTQRIRDVILTQALPDVVFDGWSWNVASRASVAAGFDKSMALAVFPGGSNDFVGHFSDFTDRQMLASLKGTDPEELRIRDRVKTCVMARLQALMPWREATRRAVTYWAVPFRHLQASRILWRTADRIWLWAGDTATDYNHYTKRALLSGVISATTLAWLNDDSGDPAHVEAFLDRRIENVMQLGKLVGRRKRA